jgi:hypothetical protein
MSGTTCARDSHRGRGSAGRAARDAAAIVLPAREPAPAPAAARLALLARDERSFKADIQAASAWLRQYFDCRASRCKRRLRRSLSMPRSRCRRDADLAASIDAVRMLKAVADRVPDHAPARAK